MEIIMQTFKTVILVASVTALTGCASWDSSPICPKTDGWQAWNDVRCNVDDAPKNQADPFAAMNSMAAELAASKQHMAELERQLAGRDKELADLRGTLLAEEQKLKTAQRGLLRALRPQIEKGDITVDLNNERLLISLASNYLFGSGQDEVTPEGIDALKRVGAVLKDYPEYKVAVDGHTDNVPIGGELKNKFPTNKELSESRAANAAKALTKGGLGVATTTGYADSKPVEPNTTPVGRAKNRRVEIRVTK
jgi:chemotaxis protein MotB